MWTTSSIMFDSSVHVAGCLMSCDAMAPPTKFPVCGLPADSVDSGKLNNHFLSRWETVAAWTMARCRSSSVVADEIQIHLGAAMAERPRPKGIKLAEVEIRTSFDDPEFGGDKEIEESLSDAVRGCPAALYAAAEAPTTAESRERKTGYLTFRREDGTLIRVPVPCPEVPDRVVRLFNDDPQHVVQQMLAGDALLLGDGAEPMTKTDVAQWLLTCERLNKKAIGKLFSDESCLELYGEFVHQLDFSAFNLYDEALRFLVSLFVLQGEAQHLDRLLYTFASCYHAAQPQNFGCVDTAHIMAFSILMLNTDAHSAKVKSKMTEAEFIRNNRGIGSDGSDLDPEYLSKLYRRVVADEIQIEQRDFIADTTICVVKSEDLAPVKMGWLRKTGGRFRTTQRRWIILSGSALYYFTHPKDADPRGFVQLENVVVAPQGNCSFTISSDCNAGVKSAKFDRVSVGARRRPSSVCSGNHKEFNFTCEAEHSKDAHTMMLEWVTAISSNVVRTDSRISSQHGSRLG
jgi:hypothetical protein